MFTVPRLITYEEWLNMPAVQDGVDEIVEGKYRLVPPARYAHAEIVRRLNRLLDHEVDETKVAVFHFSVRVVVAGT